MRKLSFLFSLLFLFSLSAAFAQAPAASHEMNQLLSRNIKYPVESRKAEVQGMVVVSIRIDQQGYMSDYEFLSGDLTFADEIDRSLGILKENWEPSFVEGNSQSQQLLMSFNFKLSKAGHFPPNPFTSTSTKPVSVTPIEAVNTALEKNPYSARLLYEKAELLELDGKHILAQMAFDQAKFLETKMLTEIVIVGYAAQGPQSL